MAKKKDTSIRIVGAFALVLGIVAFCMMFVDCVKFELLGVATSLTGSKIAFGYTVTQNIIIGEVSATVLNFNVLAFLGFLLPLAGGVLALLFKNGLITKIVTTGCFVAGAVMLFTIVASLDVGFLSTDSEGFNDRLQELYNLIKEQFVLGAGAIAGGVLSIVGAVVCFFKGTIAKIFSK